MPIHGNSFSHKDFLASAVCVSDILSDLGYTQAYFTGQSTRFAGTKNFLNSHKIQTMDEPHFQAEKLVENPIPSKFRGIFGMKDSTIFDLAKNYINSTKQPFALYISTSETHIIDAIKGGNYVNKDYCPDLNVDFYSAYKCSDRVIADFVNFVKNSKFAQNTTIIILGDHLSWSPKKDFFKDISNRFVFNAFINPKFTREATLNLTKNRVLSHFDITPLILDSIGLKTEFFGLGRNPLYQKTLLESSFYTSEFNELLSKRNKIYDKFWEVKK